MSPDIINGLFECAGGFFIALSVRKLHADKAVRGVSWMHAGFFAAWGFWNLYYYSELDQLWSFWGGIGVVFVNTIWVAQLVYYTYHPADLETA